MKDWKFDKLDNLVKIDPEHLDNSTEGNYQFYYIDISSVSSGVISFPSQMITFNKAPSRARKVLQSGDLLMSSVSLRRNRVVNISEFST